jgi:hypothetical protein
MLYNKKSRMPNDNLHSTTTTPICLGGSVRVADTTTVVRALWVPYRARAYALQALVRFILRAALLRYLWANAQLRITGLFRNKGKWVVAVVLALSLSATRSCRPSGFALWG